MSPIHEARRRLVSGRELASILVPIIALLAPACDREPPTGLELKSTNAAPLSVSPRSLAFAIPPTSTATVTGRVQFTGTITARTSDPGCATVSPLNVPATKPPGSSQYVATFTVTSVAAGSCTITVTDKQGRSVPVQVQVSLGGSASIVYAGYQDDKDGDLYRLGTGSTPIRLTNSAGEDHEVSVSNDGTRIAFSSSRDHMAGEIYVMDADGSHVTRLTNNTTWDGSPIFAPDGKKIAFWHVDTPAATGVWIMDSDGSHPRQLAGVGFPSGFSPDGTRLLYWGLNETDSRTMYTVDAADGGNPATLGPGATPTFSPDGSRIVFASGTGLHVANADGSDPTTLTTTSDEDFDPVYSPSGAWIAFVRRSFDDGTTRLFMVKADGSSLTPLTTTPVDDPDWR
jgi:hypothetical protein